VAEDIRRIIILGSTGSIGRQTLDVVAGLNRLRERGALAFGFRVVALAAGRNAEVLFSQAASLGVREVALADGDGAEPPPGANLRRGADAAERLVREVEADVVLGAMVGSCGLPATLAAIELGRDIALANKETLVAAGALVVEACARTGARLLPVDSEHSGVWQCLAARTNGDARPPFELDGEVAKIVLTASGGALRDMTRQQIENATVEQALNHPTWDMGAKVTIDSASLTNKALELVEAHWLFGVGSDQLDVLVHPPSIVHAFVEFADGSVLAQLGAPDMRTPIQYALTHPHRVAGRSARIPWDEFGSLEFVPPDLERFPALRLGHRVIEEGGTAGAVFNAANERAVEAFLERQIPFGQIPRLAEAALNQVGVSPIRDLRDAFDADAQARRFVDTHLPREIAR
jgi:1-deoxy-D-xylulose-5-phosphate reductoisomerase